VSRSSAARRRAAARPGATRIVARWRTREPGQQRGLAQAQVGRVAPEVEIGGRFDADRTLPQRHAVEVLLEDRLLAEMPLEAECPERLFDLARPGAAESAAACARPAS
jgi:hypothetical protein